MTTTVERHLQDPEFARLYAEEEIITRILETITEWMETHDVNRAELARRLNTSRANVTQILSGRNIGLRTLGAILHALEADYTFSLSKSPTQQGRVIHVVFGQRCGWARCGKATYSEPRLSSRLTPSSKSRVKV